MRRCNINVTQNYIKTSENDVTIYKFLSNSSCLKLSIVTKRMIKFFEKK